MKKNSARKATCSSIGGVRIRRRFKTRRFPGAKPSRSGSKHGRDCGRCAPEDRSRLYNTNSAIRSPRTQISPSSPKQNAPKVRRLLLHSSFHATDGADIFSKSQIMMPAHSHRYSGRCEHGIFLHGEIGPVGNASYLHGYTASVALFCE